MQQAMQAPMTRFDCPALPAIDVGTITIVEQAHPRRAAAESFLEDAYRRAFQGKLRSHFPTLMCVFDRHGAIQAATGFRFASHGPLFLENYLDRCVALEIEHRLATRVDRDTLVEIGNLAASATPTSRGAAGTLFEAMALHLASQGMTHAVATATAPLRRMFRRIGFLTNEIGIADKTKLGQASSDWGSYYDHDPRMMVGQIDTCGAQIIARTGLSNRARPKLITSAN
jgi:hypothetical protein